MGILDELNGLRQKLLGLRALLLDVSTALEAGCIANMEELKLLANIAESGFDMTVNIIKELEETGNASDNT